MVSILNNADSEFEQSIIRIVLGSLVMGYLLSFTPYQGWMLPCFTGFLLVGASLSICIRKFPGFYWWRILFGQIVDLGAISIDIYLCGEASLPVIGVYLWVIVGNGFRFGIPFLYSAIAISTVFFLLVGFTEPFLAEHPYLTFGITIAHIIVPFYFALLLKSLTETKKRLEYLSEFDGLTGVLNRRKFNELINAEFARLKRKPGPFCVALIDLDHFKRVNDDFGHLAGDQVLKDVAKTLDASCRNIDFVARYGGEEFALLLPGLTKTEGQIVGERIREKIATTEFKIEGRNHNVTISMGVACWQENYTRAEDWLGIADKSLYTAKEEGRDRVIVAS